MWHNFEHILTFFIGIVRKCAFHRLIRRIIEKEFVGISGDVSILYGGSVNSGNCRELSEVSEVNGFLIGGASLDVHQFAEIATTITEVKKE